MARKKVGMKRLKTAIMEHHGNVRGICDDLNISRQTFYNYKNDNIDIEQMVKAARESILDIAESQLMRHVTEPDEGRGDLRAITFVLETWGKTRGWSKRVELTGADGESLLGITLDEDVQAILAEMGIPAEVMASQASRQFNELIRQKAEQSKIKIKQ
jgi:hypothetical protein